MAKKVLVVDDERMVVRLLILTLPNDYEVRQASDGNAAVAVLEQFVPDLVLLDVDMPGMNGFEVLRHVRQSPRTAHTRAVMITGNTDETYPQRAAELGADGFFTKPFSPLDLLAKVTELLDTA